MFAELFELKHFKDIDAGVWLIEAFMKGYGRINEEMAFRVAIHVGVHLICWGSSVQGWGTEGMFNIVPFHLNISETRLLNNSSELSQDLSPLAFLKILCSKTYADFSLEQVKKVVEVGRGFVVKGWEKDSIYFDGTPLKCLFV
jgi:hypothetical protein